MHVRGTYTQSIIPTSGQEFPEMAGFFTTATMGILTVTLWSDHTIAIPAGLPAGTTILLGIKKITETTSGDVAKCVVFG